MKKIIFRSALITAILVIASFFAFNWKSLTVPATVRAFGTLFVDFHTPVGVPIFSLTNMKPGDSDSKNVDVNNGGSNPQQVTVKGIKVSGSGADPKLETVLDIVIKDGATPVYGSGSPTGSKTLADFFTESNSVNGVVLSNINPGGNRIYNFQVTFPLSSGNEYQGKSVVFDLTFGVVIDDALVINEVYYSNSADKKKPKNEWIEIYNPTDHDISLKNWTLTDNTNKKTIIHPNKKIKSHGFALLSKDTSLWKNWHPNKDAVKVELGNFVGNGLDNSGDHLILSNPDGFEVDRMSWGTDTSGFTPFATNPVVSLDHSTNRNPLGQDTNTVSDWVENSTPSPGF